MHYLGHGLNVMQNPVDAETDEADLPARFDVDIAGPALVGVLKHIFDGVDHVLVARLDFLLALHVNELFEIAQVDAGGQVLLGPFYGVAQSVEFGDGPKDLGLRRHDDLELAAGDAAKRIQSFQVVGVGAGHP